MMPNNKSIKDYYEVMGLQSTASDQEIKLAYRRLARKYHPDLNKEPDAEKNFKDLGEAYEVLRDPNKRSNYDRLRAQSQEQSADTNAHSYTASDSNWTQDGAAGGFDANWFETLFGVDRQPGGDDLHGKISISLQEAYQGVTKEILFPDLNDSLVSKKIRVNIPAGIKSNQKIRLAGIVTHTGSGLPKSTLYLTIMVERDPVFDLVGNDIYLTLPVTPWEAALGASIKVPTLHGNVRLKIPPRSQGGQTFRLKNQGFPKKNPGDQLVLLKIVIPQPTTPSGIEIYQKMEKEMAFNPRKQLEDYHG